VSTADGSRVVLYQVPLGTAPEAGWPVVFNFQGTDIPPSEAFIASTSDLYEAYGVYYEASLTKALLDAGYAVLAPAAGAYSDVTYWETNISPYATSWSGCGDDELMKQLFSDIQGGTFGPLDASSLYATGISSGGYMTSRMALSYPGMFKALAIESGSWATCLSGTGPSGVGTCTVPSPLPAKHPPTLLMHGSLDTTIVPEWTVTAYVNALVASSVPEKEVDDANSGHQWIPEAPAAVLAWFQTYP
jgi:poly(3-hydroxybutyrate) depolymerase